MFMRELLILSRKLHCVLFCSKFTVNMSKKAVEEPAGKKAKLDSSSQQNAKIQGPSTVSDSFAEKFKSNRRETATSVLDFDFKKKRVRMLSNAKEVGEGKNGIVYWMSRDGRVQDNWAFLFAQKLALKNELPLHVCFSLVPKFLDATIRHFKFMLKGLEEVASECESLNINFHMLSGLAKDTIPKFVKEHRMGAVVSDFSPLRVPMQWVDDVSKALPADVPFCQVDAHNIVPLWVTSDKQEYAARTIRNKVNNNLNTYLTEFPPVIKHAHKASFKANSIDWTKLLATLEVDRTVDEVSWAVPGYTGGVTTLQSFVEKRLRKFSTKRNDPTNDALSNLSPWFHFGQISVQRCVLAVKQYGKGFSEGVAAFCEEAIVRRELADNFCYYNKNYDSLKGAYDWAQKTLNDHRKDKRIYVYSREQLEQAKTHDDLWNAAQIQMVNEGKMHGFLRMYWAKKILEWTKTPEEALEIAIYLNDRYQLDGRDPNGYVGCMWSIAGIHDQGWREREVFGKIRYMNYEGCKRKFDVAAFVARYGGKVYRK
ncbi:deoxyribodipyrimidine photo-lyase [Toxorhynchites rutilus septentrionalis]|uniref:deoxyribodipyrimidine photo-lyase n=1 Tax=Toxorhynchites rutilus septentrionalis TaxID=329112 RepID=UPI00247B0FDF|nr:deoxyribodipyrimidine photo-lyase [Toxorhynchites rutilus septentrionalis]